MPESRSFWSIGAAGWLLLLLHGCGGSEPSLATEVGACRVAQRLVTLPSAVQESSGAAMSTSRPGVLWTHNDSGGEAELYAVDVGGQLVGTVSVAGAENVDWEDVAIGPCGSGSCLYIADTGDNAAERGDVVIYRVPEPTPEAGATETAEAYPIAFPGGPQDVEAMFVLPPDRLYLISKGTETPVALYRYPGELRAGERVVLELVRTLSEGVVPLEDRVTAADATATGDRIAIRTRTRLLIYDTAGLLEGGDLEPASVDLRPLGEPQGEGLAFGPNDTVILTSEGSAQGFSGNVGVLWCPSTSTSQMGPPIASPAP